MHISTKNLSETKVQLTIMADDALLERVKQQVLTTLARALKLPGFREGKAPLSLVEKHVDQSRLQSEFLEQAVNHIYGAAVEQEKLRPVTQPQVKITKFVPFDTLEIEADVEVVGEVKLADYKKFKLAKSKVEVTAKDVDAVLDSLRTREAEKREVTRAAKDGDEVWIDFVGVDAKTKEPIKGADGKDYPLMLGSNTFIPGFETNLVGVKPGEDKAFTLTFPKDYGVKALQNRKVTFTATVKKVQEVVQPKLDDALAAKAGPFKNLADLKADIKKQLEAERQHQADQQYSDDLLTKITEKSKVAVPEVLIEEQLERIERDQRQNLMYRGQTWQEYLDSEGLTDKTYRDKQRPEAELRVKAGLVLAELAEAEKIVVTPEELDAHMRALSARYPDPQMQAELAKPQARREIASRLMAEKTIAKVGEYTKAE